MQLLRLFKFLFFVFALSANAYDKKVDSPVSIDADKFEYSEQNGDKIIKAIGKVEVTQDESKLFAETIEYNYDKDFLKASDNVRLYENKGYLVETEQATIFNRFKLGSMNNFKITTPNGSTITGDHAEKKENNLVFIDNGSYTSCKICPGKRTPWKFKAKKAKLDKEDNSLQYKNVVMELYGIPAFYSPYFFHYTGKKERKSGLLTPELGGSSYLGTIVKIPYYINIAPNQDATVKMFYTVKKGKGLEGEYRYLTTKGQIDNFFSVTSADNYSPPTSGSKPKNNLRYNFASKTDLDLAESSFLGWDINTVSDKTYKKEYGYSAEDYLTSSIYHNSYQSNGYYQIKSIYFQNLRPKNQYDKNAINQTPIILPLFESKHKVHEFKDGSYFSFESNMLNIQRYNGIESNRFSIKNNWDKYLLNDLGHEFKFHAHLRNDFYNYRKVMIGETKQSKSQSRAIPEASIDWSLPLARNFKNTNVMISPMVKAVATPTSKYNNNIYSEDTSHRSELNDTNLFSDSQYSGMDIVENTPRVSYGVNGAAYYKDFVNLNTLFGQLYRHKPRNFIYGAELNHVSDYIGRLQLDFMDSVILTYRFKLDKNNMDNKANELENLFKYKNMYFLANLLYYKDDLVINELKNRRELYLEAGFKDYHKFSASVNARRNFSSAKDNRNSGVDPNGFISIGGNLRFDDECIIYDFNLNKDYTKNNEKKANTSFWFKVTLKNF